MEFLLEASGGAVADLRRQLSALGDSLAVVGGDGLYRVHVHTDRPDDVLDAGRAAGTVGDPAVTSLDDQVADCLGGAARGVQAGRAACALVAIVQESGVADALRSFGAVVVEPSGDGAAGRRRLETAVASTAADGAVVLCSLPLADDVRRMLPTMPSDGHVVAAKNFPAAISAAAEYHPDASPAVNAAAMAAAAARCRSAEIPIAPTEVGTAAAEATALVDRAGFADARCRNAHARRRRRRARGTARGGHLGTHAPIPGAPHRDPPRPAVVFRLSGWAGMTSGRLSLESPVADIDRRVAGRTMGRKGGRPAHDVLADQFGIETVGQLLRHYPRRYIDRSNTVSIRAVRTVKATQPTLAVAGSEADRRRISIGQWVTVIATVHATRKRWTRNRQPMVTVTLYDGTGKLDLTFFNQPWLARPVRAGPGGGGVRPGRHVPRAGCSCSNQEVEVLRGDEAETVHTGRITPVHRATEGVTSRTIRELVYRALQQLGPIAEPMPADVLAGEELTDEDSALRWIHFPTDRRS